jgi:ectoine hydroxylase-related dioxygenase (phytanoyl-CoA dioxygenase family)
LADFERLCSQTTTPETCPLAGAIEKNVPIYNVRDFASRVSDERTVSALQDEWYHVLLHGPGVFVLKGMYASAASETYEHALTQTTTAYNHIIARERISKGGKGDHFAASGANDRIWNAFSKHARTDPASFSTYYANPWLAHVSAAWLGPGYRITSQVNVVKPGGNAQNAHRDYHLGFQDAAACASYPRSMHTASAFLTLQGAVAHTDMPLASGPTWLLPFSQQFAEGYLAWRGDEFRAYFERHYIAIPLEKGDGLFFNPALFHAAGANRTADVARMANLLQVSSAFGKAMEAVDAVGIVGACWDVLGEMYSSTNHDGALSLELSSLVRAIADGYPFPTNLDRRPPAPSGLAPESEQDVVIRGLRAGWTRERVVSELRQMRLDSGDGLLLD